MKIVVFGPEARVGVLDDLGVVDVSGAFAKYARESLDEPLPYAQAAVMTPSNLQDFIEGGARTLEMAQKALEHLKTRAADREGVHGEQLVFSVEQAKLGAPLPGKARMMMCANNYADHAYGIRTNRGKETGITVESVFEQNRKRGPRAFWKMPSNVVPSDADVIYPSRTHLMDYEGEVAMVLGKRGKDIPEGRIREYVWGYTLENDWSLRDEQADGLGSLTLSLAKNFDTSSSLGPCIVAGESFDPQNIDFETRVSGQVRQSGNTKGMIYSFDEYLAYLSRDFTLRPGDLIAAGTCAGTAMDSSHYDDQGKPTDGKFLNPGDVVEISSPRVGMLRNRVVAK